MRVAVVGQGYVGLPLAITASRAGMSVVGYDVVAERVAALNAASSYVGDVSDADLAEALARGFLATSDPADLAGFDVAVITVPTPLRDGVPDLSYVEAAGAAVGDHLAAGALVVLESTTYPGTTTELLVPLLESRSGLRAGVDFHVGYSPERIDPGNRAHTFVNTPKVVAGIDDASLAAVEQFYGALVERTVSVGSTAEAELVKLLENTFRHVNIALVNELARFADQLGVNIWNTIDAAATKPFGFMKFTPGPGVGGHCLPIDPTYLAWEVQRRTGSPFRFVELANHVNESMPDYVVERATRLLANHGTPIDGADVLLLGLAYKANTSDWRETPSIPVAHALTARGAHVTFCDPHIPAVNLASLDIPMVPFTAEHLASASLVVILVDHAEFDPAIIAEHAALVLDTKAMLRHTAFRGELI